MTLLATLKLTAAKKPQQQAPVVQRRNKMSKRLWEQIELAKAERAAEMFTVKRLRQVRNAEGIRQSIEVAIPVNP
jgi:mRNA-degrading endonuclease HigB of HigAB toxin-antitoxin module